jgi:hypothetical protein
MHEISRAEMPFCETMTGTRTENKKEAVLGVEPLTSTYSEETQFEHRPARGNTTFFVTNVPNISRKQMHPFLRPEVS